VALQFRPLEICDETRASRQHCRAYTMTALEAPNTAKLTANVRKDLLIELPRGLEVSLMVAILRPKPQGGQSANVRTWTRFGWITSKPLLSESMAVQRLPASPISALDLLRDSGARARSKRTGGRGVSHCGHVYSTTGRCISWAKPKTARSSGRQRVSKFGGLERSRRLHASLVLSLKHSLGCCWVRNNAEMPFFTDTKGFHSG
jgi:hypothetical protein